MGKLQVGDKVTCRTAVEAYYSGYGSYPVQWFTPGMVGTIAVLKSPNVRGPHAYSHIVDFVGVSFGTEPHVYNTWRVALHLDNVVRVKDNNA